MNSISLSYQEYIKIWQVLEGLRISLDRIGSYGDKVIFQEKLLDYLTSGVYTKIADAANLMEEKLPREESIKLAEEFDYYTPSQTVKRRIRESEHDVLRIILYVSRL